MTAFGNMHPSQHVQANSRVAWPCRLASKLRRRRQCWVCRLGRMANNAFRSYRANRIPLTVPSFCAAWKSIFQW